LLHSVGRNHALIDGNKRLAWLATVVFLDVNRHVPDLTDDAAFDLVVDVARGAADVGDIAGRLHITPPVLAVVIAAGGYGTAFAAVVVFPFVAAAIVPLAAERPVAPTTGGQEQLSGFPGG
jgi:hypothetical protein